MGVLARPAEIVWVDSQMTSVYNMMYKTISSLLIIFCQELDKQWGACSMLDVAH